MTTQTTTPAAAETAQISYRCEPQWGDASYTSLEEMEADIRTLCETCASHWDEDREEMVPDFTFPEDGLREGRDYVIEIN